MAHSVDDVREQLVRHERAAAAREAQLERYAADLREVFQAERRHAQELRRSYRATVRALANAVEARDAYTGKHAERVAAYGLDIARAARLDIADSSEIEFGFLLHDVGKLAVPDAILFKAAGLTEQEFAIMSRHPMLGWEILGDIEFLGEAKEVVRHHHERFDGRGYPDGLQGEAIPSAARGLAVADALDARTTDRPYRAAASLPQAREEIGRSSGTQFDPAIVAAYDTLADEDLRRIRDHIG